MALRQITIDVDDEMYDKLEQQSLTDTYIHLAESVRGYERRILAGDNLPSYQREDYNADKRFFLAMDTMLDWFFTVNDRTALRARVKAMRGEEG